MLFWLRILRFRDIIGVLGGFRILSQILRQDKVRNGDERTMVTEPAGTATLRTDTNARVEEH